MAEGHEHAVELRYAVAPITHIDVRDASANGDGSWTMSGYAAVFDQETTLYDGKFVRLLESIDPAAFDVVLRSQPLRSPDGVVHFNHGHDMTKAVAATDVTPGQPGWLDLRADQQGLYYLAKVAPDDPDGVALASKLRTGVVKQASFAFTIARAELTENENANGPDEMHRRILEIGHLYDVCACAQGAYTQTVSQLRSYAAAIGQSAPAEADIVNPGLGGETPVSDSGRAARRRELARMWRAAHQFPRTEN